MKHIYLPIIAILLPLFSASGKGISGKIVSEENEPLYGAFVSLISIPDSTLLSSVVADAEGVFLFENAEADSIKKIAIGRMPGYSDSRIDINQNSQNIIRLKRKSTELDEVVVTGKTGVLKTKAGKFIYTPGEVAMSMPSAFDALKLTPLLNNTSDDSFSIIAKSSNAKIYINGREPKESTAEIMAMLRSIPPKNIKRIEIITNPGAIVAGSFNGGIIDIYVTLPNDGYLGQFRQTLGSNFTTFPSTSDEIYLGLQKDRIHGSAIVRYSQNSTKNKSENIYNYLDSRTTIKDITKTTGHFNGILANLNFYYNLTAKSILGLSLQTYTVERYSRSRVSTETTTPEEQLKSSSSLRNVVPFKRPEAYGAVYYTLDLDNAGLYLDIRAAASKVMTGSFRDLNFPDSYERERTEQRFRKYQGNITLKKNFREQGLLQAGVVYVNFNPASRTKYSLQGTYSEFSLYNDIIHAYASYDRQLGKYLSATIGLRWEYNHYNMRNRPSGETHKMHYGDWLPSVNLAWNLPNGLHSFSFSYWRMITNPSLDQLNPELVMSTETTGYMGNPYLKSYTTDIINFSYNFLNHFLLASNWQTSKNYYTALITKDNMTITTPAIGGKWEHVNIIPGYWNDFFGRWNFQVTCMVDYNHVKSEDKTISYAAWSAVPQIKNTIRLTSDGRYFANVVYTYATKTKSSGSVTDDGHYLQLGLTANWGKARLSFNLNNLLNTRPETRFTYPGYTSISRQLSSGISCDISFTYLFGNMKVKAAQNRIDN